MSGSSSRTAARSRPKPASSTADDSAAPCGAARLRRHKPADSHGSIGLMPVNFRILFYFSLSILVLVPVAFFIYTGRFGAPAASAADERLTRSVTPLPSPKMMDLSQFQGEHKESLYWGTYRPQVYLGIRARTPSSLIAGLMWIGVKDGQDHLRHDCKDSDELSRYGWTDHNGRDYGRQVMVDHGLTFTTSFLKEKMDGSGYGGDWAVRLEAEHEK